MYKYILTAFIAVCWAIVGCNKGQDFIDNTASFPLGWKSVDSFPLISYTVKDTSGRIVNVKTCPLGTEINASFGKMQSSFYANFQTTLSSASLTFASVDSAYLILPIVTSTPYIGTPSNLDIQVYELTEALETSISSKRDNYAHSASSVGSLSNYTPNYRDSIPDIGGKLAASIKVPLSGQLIARLIAPGSYSDDIAFQAAFKGLYITTGGKDINGFVMINQTSSLKIRIAGKTSSGESKVSDFSTGGTNSVTVNQYLHESNSTAANAAANADKMQGDQKAYAAGIFGYFNRIRLPELSEFSTNKRIFKAELSVYVIDTLYEATDGLGLLFLDTVTGSELNIEDQVRNLNFYSSTKDTLIGGVYAKRFTFNIGTQINYILAGLARGRFINVYSYPTIDNLKYSDLLPIQTVLGGNRGMQPFAPKLTLFYTDK